MQHQPLQVPFIGLRVDSSGCEVDDLSFCGAVQVRAGADEDWGALAGRAVASGWVGIESLAGVEGTVADVVRSNRSVHGQAAADTVESVRTWDRSTDAQRTFAAGDCLFTSGGSRFDERLGDGALRFEILEVSFLFRQGDLTYPVWDPELAGAVGIEPGQRAPLTRVRDAVRRGR